MIASDLRKWLSIGTGVGIEIHGDDLSVVVARVRPRQVRVLAAATIPRFRQRPASEWGAEYAGILKAAGGSHLAATVLLPRDEVIVRHLALPGVADRDLEAAVRLQIDTLHPYPEEDVVYDWSRVGPGPAVMVGIARRETIERYALLFAEAGMRVASFTFSAAVLYAALRFRSAAPRDGFLVLAARGGRLEAYGESPARSFLSVTFDLPVERARSYAAAELRLDPDTAAVPLGDLLPVPESAPAAWDRDASLFGFATALAGAAAWPALAVNLLPPAQRTRSSRAVYAPTVALAVLLAGVLAVLAAYGGVEDRRYLAELRNEIAAYTPEAAKVREVDAAIQRLQARRRLLEQFQLRTKADLDALRELTTLLEPPAWLRNLQLTRNAVTLSGEAPEAAPLLEIIDNSPLFRNSEFTAPISKVAGGESFSIRTIREAGGRGGAR